ncbi:hypothetical protein DICVIV_09542 [Dictyocaulus viviparus]|uniref:Uncharacterized protein n=1 Tax=Dictyocaulus viviparus TaxID=29172 RepID=A0A0D8XII6_DICVI|nr:hypothetical protein DICVIV_09542 [Dictyocaulus viviparus]
MFVIVYFLVVVQLMTLVQEVNTCFANGICGGMGLGPGLGGPCMSPIPPVPPPCAGGVGKKSISALCFLIRQPLYIYNKLIKKEENEKLSFAQSILLRANKFFVSSLVTLIFIGCGAGYSCGAYGCYRTRARVHGAGTVHNGPVSLETDRFSHSIRQKTSKFLFSFLFGKDSVRHLEILEDIVMDNQFITCHYKVISFMYSTKGSKEDQRRSIKDHNEIFYP